MTTLAEDVAMRAVSTIIDGWVATYRMQGQEDIMIRAVALGILLVFSSVPGVHGDDWPQWRGPNRDGVWHETGVVPTLPERLVYKWKTASRPATDAGGTPS